MTLAIKQITMSSVRLQEALQQKLALTLGKPRVAVPVAHIPDQSVMLQQSMSLARQAVDVLRARPASGVNEYQ